ncbi:MAG: GGDEF domain-containing protein [Gammaproteobacteria bacterium]|nr:GGDEF domain-containing protein [Gammaproteobacteria bacterium]
MGPVDKEKPSCPAGEPACPRLDELLALRAEAEELNRLVHKDSLTGLFNFRHFQQSLVQEMERTRRTGQPVSLMMMDLDHFKQINDHWGHEVGNAVLRQVGKLITGEMRQIDILCRYGGEEFALLLPATDLPRAVDAANRLRQVIGGNPLDVAREGIGITASIGVDVFMKGDGIDHGELVRRTDALLYQAKEQGRNRVCHRNFDLLRTEGQVSREEKDELLRK